MRTVKTRWIGAGLLVAALAAGGVRAGAQDDPALAEAAAYTAWYGANEAKDVAKAYGLAQDYVKKFPAGQYAEFLKTWVSQARGALFNQAFQKKDAATMLKIGQERLAEDPKDLAYLLSLSLNLRRLELFASPADYTHAAEAADFSRRAIELVEGGKAPAGADPAKWSKGDALGWLYQNLAVVAAKQDKDDEALAQFDKSSKADPDNQGLVAYNSLFCGSIHKGRYDKAVASFLALPEEERTGAEPGPAAKPILEEANAKADAAIACWVRFVAIAEAQDSYGETREKIAKALADLWAYRNPSDPEGYKKLIEQNRPAAAPVG